MVYLRVYSGELTPATEVYNSTRQAKERVSRLLTIQADEMVRTTFFFLFFCFLLPPASSSYA